MDCDPFGVLPLEICPVKYLVFSYPAAYVKAIDASYPMERVTAHGHQGFS